MLNDLRLTLCLTPHRDYSIPSGYVAVAVFEERDGAVYVTFKAQIGPTPQVTPQVIPQVVLVSRSAATAPRTRAELQSAAGLKDREHFRTTYLEPLLDVGLLEMTIPDKPKSSRQQYRTTAAGLRALKDES